MFVSRGLGRSALIAALLGLFSSVAFAASVVPLSGEELVAGADRVVRARVASESVTVNAETGLFTTTFRLAVTEDIVGAGEPVAEVAIRGGVIGDAFNIVTGQPNLEIGEDVVVFLDETGHAIHGGLQGKATIREGFVFESGVEAEDYISSIRMIAAGVEPYVDPVAGFHPVSTLEAFVMKTGERFGYDGLHWYDDSVDVSINENDPDGSDEGDAVREAFSTWNAVPANFKFIDSGSNSRTQVTQNYQNEVMWSNDVEGNAIAYTAIWGSGNEVVECDLAFLNSYDWSSSGNPGGWQMDTQNIATHELGHFLVLLDLYSGSDAQKTMYGYAGPGETYKRSLEPDDENGIIHIYGSGPSQDDDTDDDDDDDDDDDGGDDDDWYPDDDDGDDDGGANDDGENLGNIGSCADLLNVLYGSCDFEIVNGSDTISPESAYDLCEAGQGPWECIFACSNHEAVSDCDAFRACMTQSCGVSVVSGVSGDDDDDDDGSGGICG
ncbi:MAG: matrixin family metalloprotease [Deltaproteobacteria bacterium]|nr:matrixin family metalloprotease [Deltaproteobacteria bacterium]